MDGASAIGAFEPPGVCALCHRILSSENDAIDLESITICGDCKFLFLEDSGTPLSQDIQRRTPRTRRTRYNNNNNNNSSESIESIFSQQFSNMINLARHNQSAVSETDNRSVDSVSRTNSRRWRRVVSDTESEGFDSVYGESDGISYVAYGGDSDSDVSVDVRSFIDESDDDTDIDPMHAGEGLNQWSSDDDEDDDESTLGSLIARVHLRRISERTHVHITNPFGNMEEQERVGHAGDYLDSRSFEELLERLADAENNSSRRGAPPAAVSFVNNMERVMVKEEEVCAICKDGMCVGSVVNRLPCKHEYHTWCIKAWLSGRNSCPLCRYEVPTDDVDYDNRKQSTILRVQQQGVVQEEEDEEVEEGGETMNNDGGGGRGRWLFVASMVGIGVALWLGGRAPPSINLNMNMTPMTSSSTGQRVVGNNRSRRWWSLF